MSKFMTMESLIDRLEEERPDIIDSLLESNKKRLEEKLNNTELPSSIEKVDGILVLSGNKKRKSMRICRLENN